MTESFRLAARDIGLFLVMALFANLLFGVAAGGVSARDLMDAFYLIALVHIGASLFDGMFDRARTATWIIFILGWTVAECTSFAAYVVPKGQLLFWLASDAPWAAPLLERLIAAPSIVPAVLLAVLAIDVFFAHRGRCLARPWPWRATLIAAALAIGLLSSIALRHIPSASPPETPLSFAVVPSWHLLPYYALLRTVADKTLGIAITLAAILAPIVWPWIRPRVIAGVGNWLWLIAWLAFVAAFLSLGYLGSQMPDDGIVMPTRLAAGYYFVFLLILPLAWRISASRPT